MMRHGTRVLLHYLGYCICIHKTHIYTLPRCHGADSFCPGEANTAAYAVGVMSKLSKSYPHKEKRKTQCIQDIFLGGTKTTTEECSSTNDRHGSVALRGLKNVREVSGVAIVER